MRTAELRPIRIIRVASESRESHAEVRENPSMNAPASPTNDKRLREFDMPAAVEQLVFEVRASSFEQWKELDFEMWTTAMAERSSALLRKEVWVQDCGEWLRVSVVVYWRTLEEWQALDPNWLEAQDAAFVERVGADNVRLVSAGHDTGAHYFKINEFC